MEINWSLVCTVLATLLSPLIAIQVGKYLDRRQAKETDRKDVYFALMTTRKVQLDPRRINALNSIDLVFAEDEYKPIRDKWKEYLHHLGTNKSDANWDKQGEDLYYSLLHVMGKTVGYDYDIVHLQTQSYLPQGHGEIINDSEEMRRALKQVLNGDKTIKIHIDNHYLV